MVSWIVVVVVVVVIVAGVVCSPEYSFKDRDPKILRWDRKKFFTDANQILKFRTSVWNNYLRY